MAEGYTARTGIATLPLHYGKAPRWLFQRMTRLGDREKLETLRRLAIVERWDAGGGSHA